MNDEPYDSQPQQPDNSTQQPAPTEPVISSEQPNPPERRSHKVAFALLAVSLLLIGAAVVYATLRPKETKTATPTPSNTAQKVQKGVTQRLLQQSRAIQGMSVGYVQKTPSATSSGLFPKVSAAEDNYAPAIFFIKDDPKGIGQVTMLNTLTKESKQLTSGSFKASDPVFSSTSQKLAYTTPGTSKENCSLFVLELGKTEPTTVKAGQAGMCYRPVAWSPDGTRLAYTATNNDLDAEDWSLTRLMIYADGKTSDTKIPTGHNSVSDLVWKDASTLWVKYAMKGAMGAMTNIKLYSYDVNDLGTATEQTSVLPGMLADAVVSGDVVYTVSETPRAVIYAQTDNLAQQTTLAGTEELGNFLLRYDDTDKLSEVVFAKGASGTENSFKLNSTPATGGDVTTLYDLKGFSNTLLGWGNGYDEVIYLSSLSGKAEIRLFTISTKQDSTLVTDLPLVQ